MVYMNCIGEVGESTQLLYPYILLLNSRDALLHELGNLVLLHFPFIYPDKLGISSQYGD
jgi:hypothetical protein